ncbi:MAG: DUF1330 domain-containing protein [Deltaproteobacteria bacterium]|jgi:uncharacterized protein (DUF1330 family)|nr:DUF1330 domain-containing protein [Deltaproteobacteria bacterium]
MSAYLIGHITIKNPDKWKTYVEGVQKSLIPFEAEVVFRGKRATVLAGAHHHQRTVVIKFPDQPTLQQWYNSKEYQGLIPVRDEAADVVIISYDA